MTKNKSAYEAPKTESLVIRFEGNLLTGSPDGTWNNSIKQGSTWGSTGNDYGLE